MLDTLFLSTATIALILSIIVTWHVFTSGKLLRRLSFGALMLSLVTFAALEFFNTLLLISPTNLSFVEPFLSAVVLVLLLMAYSKEVLYDFS